MALENICSYLRPSKATPHDDEDKSESFNFLRISPSAGHPLLEKASTVRVTVSRMLYSFLTTGTPNRATCVLRMKLSFLLVTFKTIYVLLYSRRPFFDFNVGHNVGIFLKAPRAIPPLRRMLAFDLRPVAQKPSVTIFCTYFCLKSGTKQAIKRLVIVHRRLKYSRNLSSQGACQGTIPCVSTSLFHPVDSSGEHAGSLATT